MKEDHLGPAHQLVRRCVARAWKTPEQAVTFVAPLRTARGLIARGSHLLHRRTLRQLVTWARRAPRLAIVLVDEDGQADRRGTFRRHIEGLPSPPHRIIAVARQEFEPWLIADHAAVVRSVSWAPDEPGSRESLAPREAKELLIQWTAGAGAGTADLSERRRRARLDLAHTVDLRKLDALASFRDFADDLRQAAAVFAT